MNFLNKSARLLTYFSCLSIFVGRFFIEPRLVNIPTLTLSYEAFAHLLVGGMFGAWMTNKKNWGFFWCALLVSLFELGMFLVQKSNL